MSALLGERLGCSTLLVLGVGFVASIFIGGLVGALDRGKQKRTMGNIRELATVLEAHAQAQGSYPVFDGTAAELAPSLMRPANSRAIPIPTKDDWGNPLLVRSDGKKYAIVSFGCCGEPDVADPFTLPVEGTNLYRADIVFRDGSFTRFPDGAQD